MHDNEKQIPVWFFIGCLLAIYGVLILGSGIYNLFYPPERPVALANLHADIWWSVLLLVVGLFYGIKFRPSKDKHVKVEKFSNGTAQAAKCSNIGANG